MNHIIQAVSRRFNKLACDQVMKKIITTAPTSHIGSNDVAVLSMIGKRVINDYLVAIKSFLFWYPEVSVHVLSDGTLDDSDRLLIRSHIHSVTFYTYNDVSMEGLPTGNCWERLVTLLNLAETRYVIQLDSDIVVNAAIPEVKSAVESQVSFVIGDPNWSQAVPLDELSRLASQNLSQHVQSQSEHVMSRIPSLHDKSVCYLRGCAGFTGIPKGVNKLALLRQFSQEMAAILGEEKWSEWGSEQVASNFIASTCQGGHVLPWPQYQTYMFPQSTTRLEKTSLIHFMGTCRYRHGEYKKAVNRALTMLSL
ncbi:hypothetical protein [Photobacterium sanguinicancri]|uniref:hypothetical protein n=1 Tax=Photobacterium sanguinicancri TaxID=875932 RepID=UPI0021C30427|nr:hypothetical protein [Photobacterium sanguinicancri]